MGASSVGLGSRQPFWFDDALKAEGLKIGLGSESEPLPDYADVCIVGGGYTGLWTGIKIKQKSPQTQVVIIEQGLCGQGASGRNGGAMLTWSTKFPTLVKHYGIEAAKFLVNASENAVGQIAEFAKAHNIDADIRVDGAYYTATNQAQVGILQPAVDLLSRHQLNQWQTVETQQLHRVTGSSSHLEGIFNAKAGSLHPGKLVRGLRQAAIKLGVIICEHCTLENISRGYVVQTSRGIIRANQVVMATNSWMARQFAEFNRRIVLVSSDMVITTPVPQVIKALGLAHGASVIDSRTFVHYYRTTSDGRLMLGKGGNNFAFANIMLRQFNAASDYEKQLQQTLKRFFPRAILPIERSWNGASDRSANGFPFFGKMKTIPGVFYGLGYSGNGVVQTFVGGEILSSMVLGLDDEFANCALVDGIANQFPPEPLRYAGAIMVRNAIRRKELREDSNLMPRWWDTQLAKLADFAGKADA